MRYEIPYEQINSQKDMNELVPHEWIIQEDKEAPAQEKRFRPYLLGGTLGEFASTTFDDAELNSNIEASVNGCLINQFKGKPIPSHGFKINIYAAIWQSSVMHPASGKVIPRLKQIILRLGYKFPYDDEEESCLRTIIGLDKHHTVFFQIPFRLLSKKVSNQSKKPVRKNHWVYRIRFILKDEEKYKKELSQYYHGYIGATSQPNVAYRFQQHYTCYKSDGPNEIYKSWRWLREQNIEHIMILEVIDRCSTNDEAFRREAELIEAEGTLSPNGFNMTPGGEKGIRQCKASGIDADLENKEDRIAEFLKSNRKKDYTYVSHHRRVYKSGIITEVRGHWRCFTDKGREILKGIMGLREGDYKNAD